ncbi:putative carboxylesterase [Helianthus debilis subsp. tardiflorus]
MMKSRGISLPLVVLLVSLILYPTFARKQPPPNDPDQTPRQDPFAVATPRRDLKQKGPSPDPREQKDQQPPQDPEPKVQQPAQDPREQKDQQPPRDPKPKSEEASRDPEQKEQQPSQDPGKQKDQQPPRDPTEQKGQLPPQDPREQKDQQPPGDPLQKDRTTRVLLQKDQQPPQDPEPKGQQPALDPREQKDQQPPRDPKPKSQQPSQDPEKKEQQPSQDPGKQKDQQPPRDPTEQKAQQPAPDPREQKDQQPPGDPLQKDRTTRVLLQKDQQPPQDPEPKVKQPSQDPREQKDQQPPRDPKPKSQQPSQDPEQKEQQPSQDPRKQKDQQPPRDPTEQKGQLPPQDPREQKDQQPPRDPLQKDRTTRVLLQKDQQPPQDPEQKDPPPIPKNHLPQNPKSPPPPIPENHLPQNPKIKPRRDSIPISPPQDEAQRPTQFHNRFKGHFSAVYAFGDSYTDTGNAQTMGSLTPSFSDSKSSPYGTNRLSDGRLVIDYITDSLGLPVLPPYQSTTGNFTHGVNFAIAGATALAGDLLSKLARFFLSKGAPLSVMTQLEWYKKFQKEHLCKELDQKACAEKLKTALFWVGEMGINDYSRAVGSKISLPSIAKSSAAYTIELVRTLIQSGAKHIVVQGLPPIGCLPVDVSVTPLNVRDKSGCSPVVNGAVMIHNQLLQAKLDSYRKSYPDVTLIYADSWKAYYAIVNDPQKYQILETQKTCCGTTLKPGDMNFNILSLCGSAGATICGDPSQYISWDGIHPTESMNSHMTDQFINNGCCHPPFEELMKNKKSPL